ncbi:Ig-like domain-containing protein [Deinococcus oregonensis]|uniref:Ig-like domain-containing protein n=1 Tax=Deinococcus oregonensis TaxID=1805970 RepID=A0ABV6B6Y1_9DEIO
MKILNSLKLSGAMLGLTVLLTACPGVTPPATTFDLTVALTGVTSAPITVTNTTTGAELFKGTLDASKTFTGLTANDALKVEGGAVNGYTAPAAQTVTLDASKTVTLAYIKVTPAPDVTAPQLALSATPTTITGSGTVQLTATASDNVGVTKVSFYQGNTLLSEDATVPYEATDNVPAQAMTGKRTYRAVAIDAAGNATEKTAEVTTQPVPAASLPNLEVRFSRGGQSNFPDSTGVGRKVRFALSRYPDLYVVLTEGVVGADYKLTLAEIPLSKLTPLLYTLTPPAPCQGNYSVSDPELKVIDSTGFSVEASGLSDTGSLGLYVSNPDGSTPPPAPRLAGFYPNSFWYADRAATVTGTVDCSNTPSKSAYVFELNLNKGWNLVQQSYRYEASTQTAIIGHKTLAADSVILAPF